MEPKPDPFAIRAAAAKYRIDVRTLARGLREGVDKIRHHEARERTRAAIADLNSPRTAA